MHSDMAAHASINRCFSSHTPFSPLYWSFGNLPVRARSCNPLGSDLGRWDEVFAKMTTACFYGSPCIWAYIRHGRGSIFLKPKPSWFIPNPAHESIRVIWPIMTHATQYFYNYLNIVFCRLPLIHSSRPTQIMNYTIVNAIIFNFFAKFVCS